MGGGVIRTAAKAAPLGAFRRPIIDEAARRGARHQVAAVPSAMPAVDSALTVSSISSDKEKEVSSTVSRLPAWEIDDWEVASVEKENLASADPSPRLVFAPLPTLEEATKATSDLKDAIEMVYFQPNYAPNSHRDCQASVSGGSSAVSSIPNHVAQMFSLLQGSSEAQVVVASLASDKNVWEAVMKNEAVMEFCNNTPTIVMSETNNHPLEPSSEAKSPKESSTVEPKETTGGSMFANMLSSVKLVVHNMSDVVQGFFGIEAGNKAPGGIKAKASVAEGYNIDLGLGAAFMALAVAVIMVILLKRV